MGTHTIAVELNRAAQQEMTVTVQCVAGDAMEGADVDVQKTITFAPGERKKIFNVTVKPTASFISFIFSSSPEGGTTR